MMICEFNQFTDEEEFEGFHNEEDGEDVAKVIIQKQYDFDNFFFQIPSYDRKFFKNLLLLHFKQSCQT